MGAGTRVTGAGLEVKRDALGIVEALRGAGKPGALGLVQNRRGPRIPSLVVSGVRFYILQKRTPDTTVVSGVRVYIL